MPKYRSYGFTLIELMVVISIIAIMAIILLPQFGQFSQGQFLSNSAYELQASIRAVQNSATSGLTCSNQISAANWFFRFYYDNSLSIGTYKTGNNCPPSLGATPTPIFTSSSHVWSSGVSLGSIIVNSGDATIVLNSANPYYYDVLFDNINGQVTFSTNDPGNLVSYTGASYIQIKLSTASNGKCQKVIIQKGGSVNVAATCP